MINKIGIQNFRVFKEYTEFEIRPITLLVGPNNAGKSSFTKLLLLLKNDVANLNFDEDLHNLESFDKVLNWETGEKEIKITFGGVFDFLDNNLLLEVVYSKYTNKRLNVTRNQMTQINVTNGIDTLLSVSNEEEFLIDLHTKEQNTYKHKTGPFLNLNVDFLMKLIYFNNKAIFPNINLNKAMGNEFYKDEDTGPDIQYTIGNFTIEDINKIYNLFDVREYPVGSCVLKSEFQNLEKDYLIYDLIVNGELMTLFHKDKIIELQQEFFTKIPLKFVDLRLGLNENASVKLTEGLLYSNEYVKIQIKNYFSNIFDIEEIEIKETRLGKLLFTKCLFEEKPYNLGENLGEDPNYQKTFFQFFGNFTEKLTEYFKTIEYVSATRGNSKRVLDNKTESDIAKIVLDFYSKEDKNRIFLEKIFAILDIPGKLIVESFENSILALYLLIDDKKIALADVGYGFSQVIPIIIKIASIVTSDHKEAETEEQWKNSIRRLNFLQQKKELSKKILIIEEPEANLHPSLQSKIADVLVTTIGYYPFINFIIETHSEYLIRKLQFLTAKREIDGDKSIIYYFNADKYVTANEPKVKPIEITSNGNLTNTFGPGFYDEISRLQFDLLKLNQEQNN